MRDSYEQDGCFLESSLLGEHLLSKVDQMLLEQITRHVPDATSIQDPKWIDLAMSRPDIVTDVYDAARDAPLLIDIARAQELVKIVKSLIDAPVVYHKVPLRIDVPFENKELAFWHQDDFYVAGNSHEVTVWIPLQDTFAHTGALSVMKGSHTRGPIPHSYTVGKKTLPTGIFDRPINIVEMRRGDALFFSSYLIHSSNLNISDRIRYSIQLRYSSITAGPQSAVMKGYSHV